MTTRGASFDVLAPGLYAWGVTVAWPVSHRFAPLGARIFAVAAVVALLAGAALLAWTPAFARIVGLWVFVACCIGVWGWHAWAFSSTQLDPVQGALGSVAWALFAITWGRTPGKSFATASAASPATSAASSSPAAPSPTVPPPPVVLPDPSATPRHPIPKSTPILLAIVFVAAALPMILAWWVQTFERALLAHAVSLAFAIALVTFGVEAVDPMSRVTEANVAPFQRPSNRISGALPSLLGLVFLALVGAAYLFLR